MKFLRVYINSAIIVNCEIHKYYIIDTSWKIESRNKFCLPSTATGTHHWSNLKNWSRRRSGKLILSRESCGRWGKRSLSIIFLQGAEGWTNVAFLRKMMKKLNSSENCVIIRGRGLVLGGKNKLIHTKISWAK